MPNKILIVENDQRYHDLYKSMLEGRNYDIISAYDWTVAKKRVEQENPDLIITEMQLEMSKVETIFLHIRELLEYADMPVIIISAFSQRYLMGIDLDFVYIDKSDLTEEKLIEEVDKKLQ